MLRRSRQARRSRYPATRTTSKMASFDRPGGRGLFQPSVVGGLPGNPTAFTVNWGLPILSGLAFLLIPHPAGFYFDVVKRRIAPFFQTSLGVITPITTKFGLAYQFGLAAGGSFACSAFADTSLRYPSTGITIACGAYNQAAIANVTMFFALWNDAAFLNSLNLVLQNGGGFPRMAVNVTSNGTNTNVVASGGAGTTLNTAGQYMTFAGAYNQAASSILADYNSSGQGHQTGSGTASGALANLGTVSISEPNGGTLNSGRTMTFMAGWNRSLSASELQTVTSYVGGLPPGWLRRR